MNIPRLVAVLLLTGSVAAVAGEPPRRPLVLELFTSQSCSSCPPADALLVALATHPDLLPLAFHVTYWNQLAWTDPFSLPAATQRQASYAALLRQDGLYTPELVVDGRLGVVGSDRAAVASALQAASRAATAAAGLRLDRAGTGIGITVGRGTGAGTIWLVGFDRLHRTAVGRGENGGRTLLEADIVRSLLPAAGWSGTPLHLQMAMPAGERIAAFLQAPDGRILDAARLSAGP